MDSSKINDWLQVVGLFGVIGSLLFVGLQMKQDQEIARSSASQARTELSVQYLLDSSANAELASAESKLLSGNRESLDYSEKRVLRLNQTALLFVYENIHYQYVNGFVAQERWQGTRASIKSVLLTLTGLRERYEANPAQWSESFQDILDKIIAEIDAEAAAQ